MYRAQKARAAKKIESEDELIEQDEEERSTKKKRSKRSQVWPWENPGVESEDEVWIDGNIKPDEIGVHRLDITKGRKKNADGFEESEGITIMSQKMQRKRDLERYMQQRVDLVFFKSGLENVTAHLDATDCLIIFCIIVVYFLGERYSQ